MAKEQEIITAKNKISKLKESYLESVSIYLKACDAEEENLSLKFLNTQQTANKYFNSVDEFVGNSDLLGAHKNALWVTGFAEDCVAVLSSLCVHLCFLRGVNEKLNLGLSDTIEPSSTAYSNIQRMVVEYSSNEVVDNIKQKLIQNKLPVFGLENRKAEVMERTENWKLIVGLIIGVIALLGITTISIFVPDPTAWQMFVF